MKICYIGEGRSPHVVRIASWFAQRGHEVHLTTDTPVDIENVKIHPLKKRGGGVFSFMVRAFQTRKIVRKIKPDVLHAHFIFGYGFFGAFSGFHPLIMTMWGDEIIPETEPKIKHTFVRKRIAKFTINYALKKADLIQTLDSYQKELCIEFGVPEDKIVLLYNYVDTNVFSPNKRSQKLREELGIGNDPAIICLRGFDPHYDTGTFIEAISHVLKEESDAKFVLAGNQGTKKDKEKIFDLAKKLGITSNISFVGHIPLEKLPMYLASCDIHVDPLRYGAGVGHGNMQTMSCGLPRIAADRKGVEETVKDEETGYVYRGGDPKDLADKIIFLIKNDNLRKVFGNRCREFVENINRSGQNENGIEKYYEELIAKYKK